MSMRIIRIATYLTPEDAHSLIAFLDDVRDSLMVAYGPEIKAMLQEATRKENGIGPEDIPF